MKRILLFIDSLGAGGAQRQLVGLACLLKEKGYKVKVITYHNFEFYQSFLAANEIEYKWLTRAQNPFFRLFGVAYSIKRYKPTWVIAYLDTPCMIACLCKVLGMKFRLLVSERNTTQRLTIREKIKFMLYKFADIVVPNSYSQECFVRQNYPKLMARTCTIPNFVDTDYFRNTRVHIRGKIPVIIVVATIWPSKNTLGFIEAINLLRQRKDKFIIYWYGKSQLYVDYFEQCQILINNYGLSNHIKLLDKTQSIKNEYLKADYFCLPSFYEGTPNALCEAISCGLPVICSNVCDNSIYCQDGKNGFLFDPKNVCDIANKIEMALGINDDVYLSYSMYSRGLAEQLLSKSRFIENYISILN